MSDTNYTSPKKIISKYAGDIDCNKCRKKFHSPDKTRNRTCPACGKINKKIKPVARESSAKPKNGHNQGYFE